MNVAVCCSGPLRACERHDNGGAVLGRFVSRELVLSLVTSHAKFRQSDRTLVFSFGTSTG